MVKALTRVVVYPLASAVRTLNIHKVTMSAFTMTSAKVFAAPKVGVRSTSRRGAVVVRAEKISHGKGGEEGGAVLNNDAFGMVAKVASYSMFATAAQKVRRPDPSRRIRPRASRVPSHRRVAPTSPIAVARGTGKNSASR